MSYHAVHVANDAMMCQLPRALSALLTFERFHLYNVESFFDAARDPTFDRRYLPQNCGVFRLQCFWVPRRHLYVYGSQGHAADEIVLFRDCGLQEQVLFPIHPTSLARHTEFLATVDAREVAGDELCIWAVPTSSTRTLLAWPDGFPERALFLKTSLHTPLFGDRRLHAHIVGRSVGLSRLVSESSEALPAAIECFPEPVGFVPRKSLVGGVVARSMPRALRDGQVLAAPLFALLGGTEEHRPLLLSLHARMPLRVVIEDVLCRRFAQLWLQLALGHGLIIEAHGQDLMLELTSDCVPTGRFFYRDFEGLQVDWELRRALGLPQPADLPHAWVWRETYGSWGHPYNDLAWGKLKTSLFQYRQLVLREIETRLGDWQRSGLIGPLDFQPDETTRLFSNCLLDAVADMFGIRIAERYNIYQSLNRFLLLLTSMRRELIGSCSART